MRIREVLRNEKGNIVLTSAFLFVVLTAFAGLVVDGGHLYLTKSNLQKAANAAVLSGGQELTRDSEEPTRDIVHDILEAHDAEAYLQTTDIELKKSVKVSLTKPVELFFSKIVGVESVDVSVSSKAQLGVMSRAFGAAPIGIDDSIPLVFGQEYVLKVDEEGVDTGFFGALALEGPGAKLYEDNLLHGFDGELKVGDIVDTQTGNIAGPTKSAIDILVNSCSDPNERDCPRVLLIPVYVPYNVQSNQMKQVKIVGFAYFYISEPMNSNDKTIKGKFLRRVGTGFEDDSLENNGALTIRLVE
ncbi:Tad domain-containing protein [Paenisporosarcina cavernae]|uniref:Putative Flp pilus-assembly TadG-like N-terminal domain-containing protein n=1 Tax=Paenisporosarcina cavernae TaxID=2320858 RepID=A0A385YPJ1_9BACL|nr:Tad domain-containing protein [Paenisporosarcina cavernae]AYC28635.1 hypothetical protein D3873_01650 [Paenisporosarcina cavernae]